MSGITEGEKLLLEEQKKFIKRFQDKYNSVEKFKIINDKQRFSNLFIGTKTIKSIFDNVSEYFADSYNVFKILRKVKTKEEITHTPFLSNLLNVKGNHKQKQLFYNNFINETFKEEEDRKYFSNIDKDFFNITTEKITSFGRLDIFIEHYSKTNPFYICIENKIYASDQPLQLERYYKFLQSKNGRKILIYLTIDEKEPTTALKNSEEYIKAEKGKGNISLSKELYKELVDKNIIIKISYKKHIKNLLKKSIKEIKSDNVKQIVNQYNNLIKIL